MRWNIHSSLRKLLLISFCYALILQLPLPMSLQAQDIVSDSTAATATHVTTDDTGRDQLLSDFIFRVSWVTLLILGSLFAIAALLRRRNIMGNMSSELQITERRMINQKQSLIIVKVEGRRLLLGCSDQQIQLLTELEPVKDEPGSVEGAAKEKKELFKDMIGLLK